LHRSHEAYMKHPCFGDRHIMSVARIYIVLTFLVMVNAQWGWRGKLDATSVDLNEDVNEAVRLHEKNEFLSSLPFYLRALRRNPTLGTVYYNVGTGLATIMRHAEAAYFFKTAVQLDPLDTEAQCRVGEQLQRSNQFSAAAEAYRTALKVVNKTHSTEFLVTALDGLAVALASLKEYEPALAEFRKVSKLSPDNARAYHNIGAMLRTLKRPTEAVALLEQAVKFLPKEARVQAQLEEALKESKLQSNANTTSGGEQANFYYNQAEDLLVKRDTTAALAAFTKALQYNSVHLDAYHRMALALFNTGEGAKAVDMWEASLKVAKGRDLQGHNRLRDEDLKHMYYHRGLMNETLPHKIKHDTEQLQHLLEVVGTNSVGDNEMEPPASLAADRKVLKQLSNKYQNIYNALPEVSASTGSVSLTEEEISTVSSTYNQPWNRPKFKQELKQAVNPNLNFPVLEEAYLQGGKKGAVCKDAASCAGSGNVMTVDKLLTPQALQRLRTICERGTYWFNVKPWGYLGAYLNDGFHVDVVLQIALELPKRFPKVFGSYALSQLWAYKYDSSMEGVSVHADDAAVNVNLWITDNDSNLDPDSGGMVVFKQKAPPEWDHSQYNDPELVRKLLKNSSQGNVTVPYKANRAVIFDGGLFHQSDKFKFKTGYKDRRINLTFLYGERGEKFKPQQ